MALKTSKSPQVPQIMTPLWEIHLKLEILNVY